jgi:hypothetical protein
MYGTNVNVNADWKLPKLYSVNRKVYKEFIKRVKNGNVKTFTTLNELYRFIEDIKFPFLRDRRRGTAPYYAGDKNYGPVINHLLKDGILVYKGYSNYKHNFRVNLESLNEPVISLTSVTMATGETIPVKIVHLDENSFSNMNKTNMAINPGKESKTETTKEDRDLHKMKELIKLSSAEIHLENAAAALRAVDTLNVHMNARVYNLIALTQDILSAVTEKKEFLINQK